MPHKRKGRKIYTYRVRNRKMFSKGHPMRSALGILVTIVLAVFAGIVGYSIGAPVMERLSAEADSPTTVPAETTVTTTTTAQTDTTAATTVTTAAETTVTTTTERTVPQRFDEPVQLAYCVAPENMYDTEYLEMTAESLSAQGYTAMMFPLKDAGGALLYQSGTDAAKTAKAFSEQALPLSELTAITSMRGMSCMACFDMLNDNVYPAAYQNGAYCFADSGSRWLNTSEEKGGKPWISPFTEPARGYLSALAEEIHAAGFSRICCTDLMFPLFRDSDVSILGSYVKNSERRAEALSAAMAGMTDAAVYTCALNDENAPEAIAAIPSDAPVCVQIAPASPDQVQTLLRQATGFAGDRPFVPWVIRGEMSDSDLDAAIEALYNAGYREIIVSAS